MTKNPSAKLIKKWAAGETTPEETNRLVCSLICQLSGDFIKKGAPTGLCDSGGKEIRIGDKIKKDCEWDREMHGEWIMWKIKAQGIVPITSYYISERGQVLPRGYTAGVLSEEYDCKMFVFTTDSKSLRPTERVVVV